MATSEYKELNDATLGILRADDRGVYRLGHEVDGVADFTIELDSGDPTEVLAWAGFVLVDRARYLTSAMNAAVSEYFQLKNEAWLEDDEEPLTEAEFRSRLTARSIGVVGPKSLRVRVNAGDMFGGHALIANYSSSRDRWDVMMWG